MAIAPEPIAIVEMRGISKAFGPVRALADVDLRLFPGEVLGLVGDNSAGKSTLMKILTGAYHRDSGEILVTGKTVNFKGPHESRDAGIEMIYQDFALCGNMDVGQNIFLGRWPRKGMFVDRKTMYANADKVLKRLKVDVNSVYQRVESLSGGRQQSVAIARAISFEPRVVILDEPTANLSVMATERLLETMLELKRHGVAQIIISHRLQDIFAVGDRVMVLKRGENVGERQIKDTTEHEVLGLIVSGRSEKALKAAAAVEGAAARSAVEPERSNPAEPVVAAVFPIAALAETHRRETVDQLDLVDVFRHLVAELALDAHAQRRAVFHRQRLAVEAVGENGLRVARIDQVDRAVIFHVARQRALDRIAGSGRRHSGLPASPSPRRAPATAACRSIWRCSSSPRRSHGG